MWSATHCVSTASTALAAIALGLAATGTYGVIAYGVSQRTRELGIRIALGASGRQIGRMVTRSALRMAVVALAVGIPGAFATTRLLEGVLFGTSPTDPLVFALATGGLVLVALGAAWHPARRAASTDPLIALRAE
jgi:ABC-type antimicrobial peptide transport system permease subunit